MVDRRQLIFNATVLAATGGWTIASAAQTQGTLRILSGFPPGGTVDAVARRVADKLRTQMAGNALVENRPGAGGRLAMLELKRSPPDGTTIILTPAGMITLYPHLYPQLGYGLDDVTPVCCATTAVFGLAVSPAVPGSIKTLRDFLAWAKANPSKANYGSPGAGSPPHFIGALLEKESAVPLIHVPYRGTVPGIQDLIGGQVSCFIGPIGDYLPHVKTGRLRVLVTSGPTRSRFLPDVPIFNEMGLQALEQTEWYGFFLPGKAAPDLVHRMATAIRRAMSAPDMTDALNQYGLEVAVTSPSALAEAVKIEHAAWGAVVRRIGFTPGS